MDSEQSGRENGHKKTSGKIAEGVLKGQTSYYIKQGSKYATKFNSSKSCAISVLDTSIKGKKNWVIRFDKPHLGKVPYDHININPKISGIKDPHIPLPPGGLAAAEGASKFFTAVNKVAGPVALMMDGYQVGSSIGEDYKNGTTRNTVETVANISGTWGGGCGGAVAGATIGSAIFPGVGTIIGGVIGGIGGGIGGALGCSALTKTIGDKYEYGIEEIVCKNCCEKFKWKRYLDKFPLCPKCL
ncbi:uncharacterized protein C13G5.2-like isoform X2 [Zophobas morio]|uniref:uncharacterized protein C13G5.2-like isoform X2 n=1 Tax=Zophobas morio TaxID=2755281 RepID=UPI003082BFE4